MRSKEPPGAADEEGFELLDWEEVEVIEVVESAAMQPLLELELYFEEDTPVCFPAASLLRLVKPDETLPP